MGDNTKSIDGGATGDAAESAAKLKRRTRRANLAILLAVASVWLGLDQLTKEWAIAAFSDEPQHILGPLSFRLIYNSGSAFGINALPGAWLGLLAFAVVVLLFFYSRSLPSRAMTVLLALVIGGALGNLADRLFRAQDGFFSGRVVDFIDLSRWPVFNLADTGIVVGAIGAAFIGSRMFGRDESGDIERSETGNTARSETGNVESSLS